MNPRARQSIPVIRDLPAAMPVPRDWTPPTAPIDLGQQQLPIPPVKARTGFRFAADEDATVWFAVHGGGE